MKCGARSYPCTTEMVPCPQVARRIRPQECRLGAGGSLLPTPSPRAASAFASRIRATVSTIRSKVPASLAASSTWCTASARWEYFFSQTVRGALPSPRGPKRRRLRKGRQVVEDEELE